jgi:hypothetical protein
MNLKEYENESAIFGACVDCPLQRRKPSCALKPLIQNRLKDTYEYICQLNTESKLSIAEECKVCVQNHDMVLLKRHSVA